jgi:hypothetical protein
MISSEALLQEVEAARNSLNTDRLDMSFGEIMSMYENGEMIINPEFQRFYRWNDYQQTRFVESILLGIPVPPIFVAEDENGRWELVDGLQRLSTVFSFFGILKNTIEKNNWMLQDGELINGLEKYSCKELPLKLQFNIKRATCRVEIIRWNSKYDLRFELFNRLNTGGSPLTNQEIRNCIYRGISSEFNNFLKELSKNEKFIALINPNEKQVLELYMEELVLRFMSLYRNANNVHKSIAQHMTDFMKDALNKPSFDYKMYKLIFEKTIDILYPLGDKIFRSSNGVFATALYDTVMIGIAENINLYGTAKPTKVSEKVNEICQDDVFKRITRSGGNNSVQRVRNRIREANRIFGTIN